MLVGDRNCFKAVGLTWPSRCVLACCSPHKQEMRYSVPLRPTARRYQYVLFWQVSAARPPGRNKVSCAKCESCLIHKSDKAVCENWSADNFSMFWVQLWSSTAVRDSWPIWPGEAPAALSRPCLYKNGHTCTPQHYGVTCVGAYVECGPQQVLRAVVISSKVNPS